MKNPFRSKASEVFFVRGYAKSGTNWLCNLLNLHPEIQCVGEFHLQPLFDGFRSIEEARWGILKNGQPLELLKATFYQMVKQLVTDVCGNSPSCGDRTPCSIRSTFIPSVKHVYITRDGRDALVSWVYHALNQDIDQRPKMQEKRIRFEADPFCFEKNKHDLLSCEDVVRDFARQWNATVVDDFEMIESAKQGVIDLDCYWIRYEDLQKETLERRNEIFDFLGRSPTKAHPLTSLTESGFGSTETNKPDEFYRRGLAGTWQEYFTDQQLSWFADEAKRAMELVGTA